MDGPRNDTERGIVDLLSETPVALAPVDCAHALDRHPNWTGEVARELAADDVIQNVHKPGQPYYRPAGEDFDTLHADETAADAVVQALLDAPCPLTSGTLAFNLAYNTTYIYQVCSDHPWVTDIGDANESRWELK